MFNKLFVLLITLLSTLYSFSQNKGKVRVFTRPDDGIIKIDSIKLKYGEFIELDTGIYTITSWAPKRDLISKTIQLDSGDFITTRMDLPYSQRYKNYRFRTIAYKINKNLLRFAPFIINSFIAIRNFNDMQRFADDAKQFKDLTNYYHLKYESSFWEANQNLYLAKFEENLANYNDANNNFNKAQSCFIISSASTVILTYIGWKLSNKLKKPTYEEEKLLTNLNLSPFFSPQFSGLSINCKIK